MPASNIIIDIFGAELAPRGRLKVSEWAAKKRVLGGGNRPGLWRNSTTPYLTRLMDAIHEFKEIVIQKSSQVGGTEVALNQIGHTMDDDPSAIMLIMPTERMADRASERIDEMISYCPTLREKSAVYGKTNNKYLKHFPGGKLLIAWANSAAPLKSSPCRIVILDEYDECPTDVAGQGDVGKLAKARTITFVNARFVALSSPCGTPTGGPSRIAELVRGGTMEHYHVPCPHCKEKQELQFERLERDPETGKGLYRCEHCGELIDDGEHKAWMLENGEWVAERPGETERASFYINGLMSPFGGLTWTDILREYEEAQGSDSLMKSFYNTILGREYDTAIGLPTIEEMTSLNYAEGQVPDSRIAVLTAGIDVQGDRLEMSIWAWAWGNRSWLIDHVVIKGDLASLETQEALTTALRKPYTKKTSNGPVQFTVERACMDTGYNTQLVYDYTHKLPDLLLPIKGQASSPQLIRQGTATTIKHGVGRVSTGQRLWIVGTDAGKAEFHGQLQIVGDEPGCVRLPRDTSEDFRLGLVAERRVLKPRGAGYKWEKVRKRNEPLDCRVYARAALASSRFQGAEEKLWISAAYGEDKITRPTGTVGRLMPVVVRSTAERWDAMLRREY